MVEVEAVVVGANAAEPVGVFGDTDESAVVLFVVGVEFFPALGGCFGEVEAVAGGEVGCVVVEAVVNSVGGGFRPHRMTIVAHV